MVLGMGMQAGRQIADPRPEEFKILLFIDLGSNSPKRVGENYTRPNSTQLEVFSMVSIVIRKVVGCQLYS